MAKLYTVQYKCHDDGIRSVNDIHENQFLADAYLLEEDLKNTQTTRAIHSISRNPTEMQASWPKR